MTGSERRKNEKRASNKTDRNDVKWALYMKAWDEHEARVKRTWNKLWTSVELRVLGNSCRRITGFAGSELSSKLRLKSLLHPGQTTRDLIASSRRSVSWCAARKTPCFSPNFSLAIYRAAPHVTERLEEARTRALTEYLAYLQSVLLG